jgi:hypothetical protein
MTACKQEPEHPKDRQLSLDIDLDSYETFLRCVLPCLANDPHPDRYDPAVGILSSWTKVNEFISTASWTKKLLLELRGDRELEASRLVRAFGRTFRGDQVGAPGRDIVEYALKRQLIILREAAVTVLEHWLDDDDDGIWLDLLNDHIDFEQDRKLKNQCVELVQGQLDLLGDADEDEDDQPDPAELEEYLEVGRKLANRARAQLETRALPSFLEKVAGVDQRLTLAALESAKIGRLVAEDARYGFILSRVGGGWQFRGWRTDGTSSFSIEPTASVDNWLVFTRF